MAKKPHNYAVFKELISELKDQNEEGLTAQKETTKSIRNLQAYFLKQDRAEARRRLEDALEEKTSLATQVSSSSSSGGGAGLPGAKGLSSMLRSKGIAGILSNFLSTSLLGAAGSGILKTALGSMVANKAFLMGFGKLFGGLLILPKVWQSITKGIEDYQQTGDLKSSITEAVLSFFRVTDGWSVLSNIGAGATAGFVAAGPPGIIAGALLGGAVSLLQLGFGKDTTKEYGINILDFLTSTPGITIFGGTLIMKRLMKSKSEGLKKLAGRGLRGGIAAMLLYPALDMIQGGFTEDPNATDIKSRVKNLLFSSKHKGMDMGYSNLDAAATGALAGFTAFGLPGALVGGILGLTYRALDEGSREFDGKTMFDRIKERLYMMFDTVFLQFEALTGSEDAKKELARRENQEKIVEARREVLNFLLDPLDNVETLLEQSKKGGFENAFTSMNQPIMKGSRQRAQLMTIRENLPDDLKSKIVTGDKPENYKLNYGALGDPNMLTALLRATGKKDTDIMNLNLGSLGNSLADSLGISRDGGKIVTEDNRQVILDAIKAIQGLEGNVTTNARGAQVYRKPTLALVAEKPGTAEYIMSDTNLARLAETIATQRENQTMTSMIPIMMGQGGGTSMPVINNSYSYQNTENSVREMPTTSSLNMMTALA